MSTPVRRFDLHWATPHLSQCINTFADMRTHTFARTALTAVKPPPPLRTAWSLRDCPVARCRWSAAAAVRARPPVHALFTQCIKLCQTTTHAPSPAPLPQRRSSCQQPHCGPVCTVCCCCCRPSPASQCTAPGVTCFPWCVPKVNNTTHCPLSFPWFARTCAHTLTCSHTHTLKPPACRPSMTAGGAVSDRTVAWCRRLAAAAVSFGPPANVLCLVSHVASGVWGTGSIRG
mgnify:CR=1 FL=1